MSSIQQQPRRALLTGMPSRGPVGWRRLLPLLEEIVDAMPVQMSIEGMDGGVINGGINLQRPPVGDLAVAGYLRAGGPGFAVALTQGVTYELGLVEGAGSFWSFAVFATVAYGSITYNWTKDGVPYFPGAMIGTNLSTPLDSGLYEGTAIDSEGRSASVSVQLTVIEE